MRYRLRTLILFTALVSGLLAITVTTARWLRSRPGVVVTDRARGPVEVDDITRRFDESALQELKMWRLNGGWFDSNFMWRAKVTEEAVECLKQSARLQRITQQQVPVEFWHIPADWSETPEWWDPRPVAAAEYYMSPTFTPRQTGADLLDCVVMFIPETQHVYVLSQWDF